MISARTFLAFFTVMLVTVGPAQAQNTAEPAVALQGTDVVSYFQPGGPMKGQTALRHDFDGARYLFSNAQNKAAFVADPDRYLPQFAGLCTADRMPADAHASETVARAKQNWNQRK